VVEFFPTRRGKLKAYDSTYRPQAMVIRIPASMPGATIRLMEEPRWAIRGHLWGGALDDRPLECHRQAPGGPLEPPRPRESRLANSRTRDLRLASRGGTTRSRGRGLEEASMYIESMTIFFSPSVQGFVSAGLLSVKQSRAGDCSGKSPNMHVTVAVRNMDWEEGGLAKKFPVP
jgi:hypothetical protein